MIQMDEDSNDGSFVQFVVLRVEPEWYGLKGSVRAAGFSAFLDLLDTKDAFSHIYLMSGLKASCDLLLWRVAKRLETLQETYLQLLKTPFGRHLRECAIFTGVTKPSTYTKTESEFEALTSKGARGRYLSFYPFTKTTDWYLLGYEERRRIMSEHIALGKRFPKVSQTLLYSFGADDQEFVVAYEMDDLKYYVDCVMALRGSESRKYTKVDTPVYTGIRRTREELLAQFGGSNE